MDDVQLAVHLTIDRTGAVKYSAIDHDDRDIDRVVELLLSFGLMAMDRAYRHRRSTSRPHATPRTPVVMLPE